MDMLPENFKTSLLGN